MNEIHYTCLFCGKGIPESDPERRDLWIAIPDEPDTTILYACHADCIAETIHPFAVYMDPPRDTNAAG